MTLTLDRRAFLAASGGGLVVGLTASLPVNAAGAGGALNAYLAIGADGVVTLLSPVTEMGQGTHTAHAAIIADELGLAFDKVRVEMGEPGEPFRRLQGQAATMSSSGSWGVRYWAAPLRKAAAQARLMLIEAGAARLKVPAEELRAEAGMVVHAKSGRRIGFATLAGEAAKLAPPADPPLRPETERRHVGDSRLRRPDLPDKVRGRTVYSFDFKRPGMVYACARLTPAFAAPITKVDEAPARAVKGVLDVVAFPGGVAVVAASQWAAMKGAAALEITPGPAPDPDLSSAAISAAMREGLAAPSRAIAFDRGGFDAARAGAARIFSADYEVPYLSHAPMEPWSVTVEFSSAGGVRLWGPFQAQDRARTTAAAALKLKPEDVRISTLMLGGGFGRRIMDDGVAPAVLVAKAVGKPLKFFWRREEEFLAGWLRPAMAARLTAAIGPDNRVTGLHIRMSGPAMRRSFAPTPLPADQFDTFVEPSAVQNLDLVRYRVGAYKVDYAMRHNAVTMCPWRAVGASHNGFFLETFIDELARVLGKDPVALRRELLAHDARALKLVDETAARAGWGKALAPGHALGFAFFESYGSLCAQVAEVSLVDGQPKVHRVVCGLDCGAVVMPDGVVSQMEGQVVMGLSAALFEAVTIAKGGVVETNFDAYRLLRFEECPQISCFILESGAPMGGVGEPALPPTAAALANALAALTGEPVRSLPLMRAPA